MQNKYKKLIVGAVGLTGAATLGAVQHFYQIAVDSNNKTIPEGTKHRDISKDDPWTAEKLWYKNVHKTNYTLESEDGEQLSAVLIKREHSNKLAFVGHGYGASHADMAPWAKLFYDMNFNILLPDARGHGESSGHYIGFGWHERHDYLDWIDLMNKELDYPSIVLFGLSMGGATVMNACGEKLPNNVKAIINDCGYSSLVKELTHQMKVRYNFSSNLLLRLTSIYTEFKTGYRFKDVLPIKQVKDNTLPILFIHGKDDTFVPASMAYELYEAANEPKELYIAENASHGQAYVSNKEKYQQTVKNFLEKAL